MAAAIIATHILKISGDSLRRFILLALLRPGTTYRFTIRLR